MNPYRRRFFGGRLEEYLRKIGDRGDPHLERFAERLGRPLDEVDAWRRGGALPERRRDLQELATEIAWALEIDESSVLARLRHGMQLDILEHTLRVELEVSVETAADLLDELRLES